MEKTNLNSAHEKSGAGDQGREMGILLALVMLLIAYFYQRPVYTTVAMGILALALLFPRVLSPVAKAWMAVGRLLHRLMSRVLIALVYGLLVVPVAWIRRLARRREVDRTEGGKTGWLDSDIKFAPRDLERPF